MDKNERPRLLIEEFERKRKEEEQSDLNKWYTGVTMHHNPTPEECHVHFIVGGGLQKLLRSFLERYCRRQ